jgi:hypothetical protein
MSLARWSKAYCHSQSTRWMMWWSFASSARPALPSSTSCSKFDNPEVGTPAASARFMLLARLKNSPWKRSMSTGFDITRLMLSRSICESSASHDVTQGSLTAMVTSLPFTSTGRMPRRCA